MSDIGWCCNWQRCRGIAVECVKVDGVELCRVCAELVPLRRVVAVLAKELPERD